MLTSCNTASLSVYVPSTSVPWNRTRVRHLLRRLGYGLNFAQETAVLQQTPATFIDTYINDSIAYTTTTPPLWANWARSDYSNFAAQRTQQRREWQIQAYKDAMGLKLRSKMTLFWHNHFVTKEEDYRAPSWMFQYYELLQIHALGNFKDFVKAIGTNEAMLDFLNGRQNKSGNPNENYARELLELFTLGENNNYTQSDITEAARALTGYNGWTERGAPITFTPNHFDSGTKVIFNSAPTNFDHDSLIDHLFQARPIEIADFIIKKIYRYFVSPELPQQTIIDQLATTFRNNNWEILPVLRQLFKSEHFFDDAALGVMIKDPMECMLGFFTEANFPYTDQQLQVVQYICTDLGQEYFNPIDVAGWQGDQHWINSNTITGRWQGLEYIMWTTWNLDQELFRDIALEEHAAATTDPAIVARSIVDRFVPKNLHTASDYALATTVFKADVQQNYYDNNQWNLNWGSVPYQVALLLQHIFRMPEFQLK